jgi:peptidoglycan L-alanyl-D-glutamate endopeptidase CwlK
MRDKVSIIRAKLLHPSIRDEVPKIIDEIEAKWPISMVIRIVQGLRTFDEQNTLYQKGRTTKGPRVTNAKPGSSYHQYGLAIDFAILLDKDGNGYYDELSWSLTDDKNKDGQKDWFEVIDTFKRHGYSSGSDWRTFKDYPHLEKNFGKHLRDLLIKYNNEDFIADTNYLNISTA